MKAPKLPSPSEPPSRHAGYCAATRRPLILRKIKTRTYTDAGLSRERANYRSPRHRFISESYRKSPSWPQR